MSLAADQGGVALVRVGQQPHYAVPAGDIGKVFAWRKAQNIPMPSAIKRGDEIEGLSGAAQTGLQRLREDLVRIPVMVTGVSDLS